MKTRSTWMILGLTAGILASGAAFAQPGGGGKGGQKSPAIAFDRIDADGNGSVTLEEFVAAHEARMARRDEKRGNREKPHSGRTPPAPEVIFGMIDSDGNASISGEEFAAHMKVRDAIRSGMPSSRAFARMDADESGRITLAEFTAAHEARMEQRAERMEERGKANGRRTPPPAEEIFSQIDTNGDETITADELAAHMESRKALKGSKGPPKG